MRPFEWPSRDFEWRVKRLGNQTKDDQEILLIVLWGIASQLGFGISLVWCLLVSYSEGILNSPWWLVGLAVVSYWGASWFYRRYPDEEQRLRNELDLMIQGEQFRRANRFK